MRSGSLHCSNESLAVSLSINAIHRTIMESEVEIKHIINIDTPDFILSEFQTAISRSDLFKAKGFEFTQARGEIIVCCNKIDHLLNLIFGILCDANHLSIVTLMNADEDFAVQYRTPVGYGRVSGVETPIVAPEKDLEKVYSFGVSPDRRSIIFYRKAPNYPCEVPF